ncbi:MAG: hypothetical protein NTW38_02395 [Candidatus Aminicenantes bacterium]|nr:hypothetical protein [Candidatus Aminicenantes bacterium]
MRGEKSSRILTFILISLYLIFHCSCQSVFSPDGAFKGTIKYLSFEGGFYGIVADNGDCYDPIGLPEEFKKDRLRVKFDGKIREDMASYHMWGVIFEITRIEKIYSS